MLTEYALTPHLFDDEHNARDSKWLEQLQEFGKRLLPVDEAQVFNTIISDLYDGSWYESNFKPIIQNIESRQKKDFSERIPALDLLKEIRRRISEFLVKRPASKRKYPDSEMDWIDEAIASSLQFNLSVGKIVTSSQISSDERWNRLDESWKANLWEGVPVVQCPTADMGDQISRFQRVCSFYDFLAFASPQIDIHGSKDLDFFIELVKKSSDRPNGFDKLLCFDLHTKSDVSQLSQQQLTARIKERLTQKLGENAKLIRLYLWPEMLERRLLCGYDRGDGKPKIIWSFSLSHVVRPQLDGPTQEDMTFSVLPARQTSRLRDRYYGIIRRPFSGFPVNILG